jgi:hypothetical protein
MKPRHIASKFSFFLKYLERMSGQAFRHLTSKAKDKPKANRKAPPKWALELGSFKADGKDAANQQDKEAVLKWKE